MHMMQQMSGRAGRAGKDTKGESFLMITRGRMKYAMDLINKPLTPLKSCLTLVSLIFDLLFFLTIIRPPHKNVMYTCRMCVVWSVF